MYSYVVFASDNEANTTIKWKIQDLHAVGSKLLYGLELKPAYQIKTA